MSSPCGHWQETNHYCSECGAQLKWRCVCSRPLGDFKSPSWYPVSYRYCPACGEPCPLPALEVEA